ncbi:DMT family transporter [uncultured Neptuniibacter sp.]|uniref:DMT family transporter n=1 Tax=uncultured Neptuniibacter sp. TaxID=502143 RepID=UPI00263723E4|nr:DMT family transporter [uncultured Neptuniibacter sp.]
MIHIQERALRKKGVLFSLVGALLLTPDAVVIRWMEIGHTEVLFWRGLFFGLGFFLIALLRNRSKVFRAIRNAGWPGILSGVFFAMNTYFYTKSLQQTSAAAALMIISTAPIFAAGIGWIWLRERISLTVWLTILITLLGMAIIVSDEAGGNSLAGNLMAVGCAVFMALNFNWSRMHAPRDITPGLIFGGIIIFLIGFSETDVLIAKQGEIGAMFLSVAIAMPIGFVLLQIAPRYISATEVSLFLLLESVIAPVWVWIVLGEAPGVTTLLGSMVIVMALLLYSYLSGKESQLRRKQLCNGAILNNK